MIAGFSRIARVAAFGSMFGLAQEGQAIPSYADQDHTTVGSEESAKRRELRRGVLVRKADRWQAAPPRRTIRVDGLLRPGQDPGEPRPRFLPLPGRDRGYSWNSAT